MSSTKIGAISISVLAVGIFCSFFPTMALASNYSVAPLVIDKNVQKRDIETQTITLVNKESHIVRIFPTVNEVSVDKGGTIQSFINASVSDTSNSVTSWIEISRARIELQPNETKQITMTIRVSPTAVAGEYHAFIGFPEGSNRPEAEQKVQNGQAPGTMVRIGIDQEQSQFLRLDGFSVSRFVRSGSKGQITYSLSNPGEDPVTPHGEIIFYDNRGHEVSSTTVNSEQKVIDGKSTLAFTQDVPSNLTLGKYKAFLSVEYGTTQILTINDTAFFYVLPIKQLLVIFAIVLFIAIGMALYLHKRYDVAPYTDGTTDVAMYIRSGRSESKDHDIDLSKKE